MAVRAVKEVTAHFAAAGRTGFDFFNGLKERFLFQGMFVSLGEGLVGAYQEIEDQPRQG